MNKKRLEHCLNIMCILEPECSITPTMTLCLVPFIVFAFTRLAKILRFRHIVGVSAKTAIWLLTHTLFLLSHFSTPFNVDLVLRYFGVTHTPHLSGSVNDVLEITYTLPQKVHVFRIGIPSLVCVLSISCLHLNNGCEGL